MDRIARGRRSHDWRNSEATSRHIAADLGRCSQRPTPGWTMQVQSTLLAKPLRHPPFDFALIDKLPTLGGVQSKLNRFLNIDVVLNVLERHFVWKLIEKASDMFLRLSHP